MKIDLNADASPGLSGRMAHGVRNKVTTVRESDWRKVEEKTSTTEGRRTRKAESVENFDISEDV